MRIKWRSPVFTPSGYASVARKFIEYLTKYGVEVDLYPLEQTRDNMSLKFDFTKLINRSGRSKIGVQFCTPEIVINGFAKYNINKTLFELNGIPKLWVGCVNQRCNELWVPDEFNKSIFIGSGVTKKTTIIPYGVETDKFSPGETNINLINKKDFVFLSNFQWTYRKGYDVLLNAYLNEFSNKDNVCLLLKVYGGNMTKGSTENIINNIKNDFSKPNAPKIIVFGNFLLDESMPYLYRLADCFVLPSRGEGWGVPYMEAMSCGLPTIGTNWSANLCFMNSKNSFLIKVKNFETARNMGWIPWYRPPLAWANPSIKHLMFLMRYVYEHPKEARKRGERARRDMIEKWDWNIVIQKCIKRLKEIA